LVQLISRQSTSSAAFALYGLRVTSSPTSFLGVMDGSVVCRFLCFGFDSSQFLFD
jgi:hypothetical protein